MNIKDFKKSKIVSSMRKFSNKSKIVFICIFFSLVSITYTLLTKKTEATSVKTQVRSVTLKKIADLDSSGSNLPFIGIVTSVSEATIRAESSGKLVLVTKSLGDKVTAGEIIATFENSAERAQVEQAEGVYEAAKAAKDIASLSGNNSYNSVTDSKNSALNVLASNFNSLDDSIRVKTDASFSDPKTADCKLKLSVPDSNLVYSIESQRKNIEQILISRDQINRTLTIENDLISELSKEEKEAAIVKSYLDDLAQAYAKAIPNASFPQSYIEVNKSQVSIARTQVTTVITSLQAAKTSLNMTLTAKNIADRTSGKTETVSTSDASIKQALGAYNAAISRYEKTILRSPLSGTLNSLTIKTGDFISAFTQIGVVSNNGALEVKAYVSEEDSKRLVTGSKTIIKNNSGETSGIVTKVAEALDPLTKKIEVRIAIIDGKNILTNGESVTIIQATNDQKIVNDTKKSIKIPLSAVKVTPDGAVTFYVKDAHEVKERIVTLGAIYGENIEIKEGLTREDDIILDARGLKEGMNITLN